MCCPYEADCLGCGPVLNVADEQKGERECERVDEVVEGSADANIEEVAEHGEVWREEEKCEEEPAVVEVLVGEEGEEEEDGFFDVEEHGGSGQHSDLYEFVVEMVRKAEAQVPGSIHRAPGTWSASNWVSPLRCAPVEMTRNVGGS